MEAALEFGTSQSYGQQVSAQPTAPGEYSADLTGLEANTTYHYRISSQDANGNTAKSEDYAFLTSFLIPNGGATPRVTAGNGSLGAGFGKVQLDSGTSPVGLAIFGNGQPGILVSEVAIPSAPATTSGRVPIEVSADSLLNTGIALANPNTEDAIVQFDFRNAAGVIYRSASLTLKGSASVCDPIDLCSHVSRFVDQSPFLSGRGIDGTLSFTSTAPISILAVRTLYNERYDFLIANLPVIDSSVSSGPQVIPQFTVGNGMKTQVVLTNPTDLNLQGRVEFWNSSGVAALVRESARDITFLDYAVPPNGTQRFLIEEAASAMQGPVWVVPTDGNPAPAPLAILSYKPGAYTLSEATVPVTMGTAHRMYVQESGSPPISTIVTIANATDGEGTVTLSLTDLDGSIVASQTQNMEARSMLRGSISSLIPSLTQIPIQGVLRVTTDLPNISVVGFRERYNERQPEPDFLFTTVPPILESDAASNRERFFPQVLNGEGFTTELILYGGTPGESLGKMIFVSPDGTRSIIDIH